jgi:hypothetical protein
MIIQLSTQSLSIFPGNLSKTVFTLLSIVSTFLFAPNLYAADSESRQIIILSQDSNISIDEKSSQQSTTYIETDIVPLPGGGNIIALLAGDASEPVYRFNLVDCPLLEILDALVITFNAEEIKVPGQPGITANVVVKDDNALGITITTQVELTNIRDTIDQVAIASGCNIFLERKSIVVDLCGN